MVLTFRSTIPERFELRGVDTNGRERVATATRESGNFAWNLRLEHPSGRNWSGSYRGEAVLDALGELMNSKNTEYLQERGRGYRQEPKQLYDPSVSLPETGEYSPMSRYNK